jgi:hypothetical protein
MHAKTGQTVKINPPPTSSKPMPYSQKRIEKKTRKTVKKKQLLWSRCRGPVLRQGIVEIIFFFPVLGLISAFEGKKICTSKIARKRVWEKRKKKNYPWTNLPGEVGGQRYCIEIPIRKFQLASLLAGCPYGRRTDNQHTNLLT